MQDATLQLTRKPTHLLGKNNPHGLRKQILALQRLAERLEVGRFGVRRNGSLVLVRLQHHEDGRVALGLALQVVPQRAWLVGFDCLGGGQEELLDLGAC